MPPKPPLDPAQLKLLRDDLDLIHLLFHRNKNQHRLLKWWQWIATLRRNLSKLLFEHDLITTAKTTPNRNAAVANYKARLEFMRKIVVPSAYAAFGTVIAMKSFAPLGLVLTGVLARVWKIIKPTEEELEAAERELAAQAAPPATIRATMADLDAEMGVVISREAYGGIENSGDEVGVFASNARGAVKVQAGKNLASMERKDRNEKISMTDALRESSSREKKEKKKKKEKYDSKPSRQKPNPAASDSMGAKLAEKERTGTPQATSASVEKTSKRKPDTEPEENQKRKKKVEDDLDALFSGLF